MANTPEYKTLKKYNPQVTIAVEADLVTLTGELLAKCLISEENADYLISNSCLTQRERAAKLVSMVMAKVRLNSANYKVFVDILKDSGEHFREVVQLLETPEPGSHAHYWGLIAVLVTASIFCFLYFCWPSLTYKFNLHHSKSLPYLSKNFVGREKEMKEIINLVDFTNSSDIRVVNIIGSPGFGKSTLAIHVGHEMVRNGVIVHYINMAEVSDKSVKKALAEKVLDNSDIKIYNPVTFERLLRWIRDHFWNTLLILDNCDDTINNQKEEFQEAVVKMVEESLDIKVLMTSRRIATFTKYYEWYRVGELSIEDACKLLDHKVATGIRLSYEEKERIANLTGNVPLALQIIGSLLQLPASPSPNTIIEKLDKELILTLSCEELPSHEQVYATISISYKYLSKEMQAGSHLLTTFPGSFDQQAAFTVFRYNSIVYNYQHNIGGDEIIRYLVRCSLLEYHERNDRYRFHRLIKEFLLLIQKTEWPHKAETLVPAVHIHYAQQLTVVSNDFRIHFNSDLSLAFLDLEHHNIEHLLHHIKYMHLDTSNSRAYLSLHTEEFLKAAVALASAQNIGLMKLRFSTTILCDSVKHCVTQIDKIMPHLEYYLQWQHITQEDMLHFYLLLINQLATCENELVGAKAAAQVYADRRHMIEAKRIMMGSQKYIIFYTELSSYYRQLGQDRDVVECHRIIIQQTKADLATCEPHQCNYYDIGVAYNAIDRYEEASEFFELSFETANNTMNKVTALIRLIYTYAYLDDQERLALTTAKLHDLHSDIMIAASMSAYPFIYGDSVQMHIIDLYRKVGFIEEANQLEAKLIDAIKTLSLRITYHHASIDGGGDRLLTIALRVLHRFYEAENYPQVVKLGNILFQGLNLSGITHMSMNVSLLIGKAKFHGGNYSGAMAQMELSLKTILDHPNNYTRYQKSTACWYLIPRLVYLYVCYHDDIIRYAVNTLGFLTCLIISPFPFILIESTDNDTNIQPSLKDAESLPSTQLTTITGALSSLSPPSFNIKHHDLIQSAVNIAQNLYEIYLLIEELRKLLHVYTCTFVIWVKLVLLYLFYLYIRQPKRLCKAIRLFPRSLLLQFLDTVYIIYTILDSVIKLLKTRSFAVVNTNFRRLQDPRYKYGCDILLYTDFIDQGCLQL